MKTVHDAMWLVSPDVRSTYSEDGAVLLDIRKGLCYSLNVVGARMLLTIDASQTGITLDGIVGTLPVKGSGRIAKTVPALSTGLTLANVRLPNTVAIEPVVCRVMGGQPST